MKSGDFGTPTFFFINGIRYDGSGTGRSVKELESAAHILLMTSPCTWQYQTTLRSLPIITNS